MESWMLLRGLSRQQLHWGDFAKHLESETGGQVFFQDLPGFGRCNEVESPMSIRAIAEFIANDVFAKVDPRDNKINLLGISMGGMVASELSKMYPQHVRSLVLVNTSFKPYASFYQRLKPGAYLSVLKAWFSPFHSTSERAILNLSSNLRQNEAALLEKWLQFRREQKPSHKAAVKQIIAASRYCYSGGKPVDDVLIVGSNRDRLVDKACSENIARAWGVDARFHPTAGHDLPLDDPSWLAKEVAAWRAHSAS